LKSGTGKNWDDTPMSGNYSLKAPEFPSCRTIGLPD
jgi:hypothetical protein